MQTGRELRSVSEGVNLGGNGSRLRKELIQLCILPGEVKWVSGETE